MGCFMHSGVRRLGIHKRDKRCEKGMEEMTRSSPLRKADLDRVGIAARDRHRIDEDLPREVQ